MDLGAIFDKIGLQLPALTMVIVLVIYFLRYLNNREKDIMDTFKSLNKEQIDAFRVLNKENIDARELSRTVIDHNTRCLAENTATNERQSDLIKDLIEAMRDLLRDGGHGK